jgi:hypothetical protein
MCPRTVHSVVYLIELQTTVNRVEEIIEEGERRRNADWLDADVQ